MNEQQYPEEDGGRFAHDKYAQSFMEKPQRAATVFQGALPPAITQHMLWHTLTHQKDSQVSEQLKASFMDMVFHVQTDQGQSLCLTLLFEHKSAPPPWHYPIYVQLLGYLHAQYKREGEQLQARYEGHQPNKPPKLYFTPIIPLVLYHGKQAWQLAPMETLFWHHDWSPAMQALLRPYLPLFSIEHENVYKAPDATIIKRYKDPKTITFLLALKYIWLKDPLQMARVIFQLMPELNKLSPEEWRQVMLSTLKYMEPAIGNEQQAKDVSYTIVDIDPKTDQNMLMEFIEKEATRIATEQGIEQGIEQGKDLGIEQTLNIMDALRAGESQEMLAQRYGLSLDKIAQIKNRL